MIGCSWLCICIEQHLHKGRFINDVMQKRDFYNPSLLSVFYGSVIQCQTPLPQKIGRHLWANPMVVHKWRPRTWYRKLDGQNSIFYRHHLRPTPKAIFIEPWNALIQLKIMNKHFWTHTEYFISVKICT